MPHFARVAALLLVVGSVAVAGCGSDNSGPCQPDESYCDKQGRLIECVTQQSLLGPPTAWKITDCGSADLCRANPVGKHFCILDPATAPPCPPGEGWTCNKHGAYSCEDGYVTAWHVCAQCNPDGMNCDNTYGDCSATGTCPGQLICHLRPGQESWCDAPCNCPDGARCPACDIFGKPGMSPFRCYDGGCYQSP